MRVPFQLRPFGAVFAIAMLATTSVPAQLNQNCTVSVLNRTVRVSANGSWVLPNVPANFGQVKARATCVQNGMTTFGESEYFTVPANEAVNLPEINLGSATPIPSSLAITPNPSTLNAAGQTIQLSVTATYPDGSTADVTPAGAGTNYTTSNAAIASISADGLVTAVSSGTVLIQAINDGAGAIATVRVSLSQDSDGDGIDDDIEISLGLDPNNPIDGQEDFDRDDLTNSAEIALGTEIRKADTDGDGLGDGTEVAGLTNPLLPDTDGDGVPDGVEVQTASNPTDPTSYDLCQAVETFSVTPESFTLAVNEANPVVSQQLSVSGELIDGKTTLDLAATSRRTTYASSDLSICNFGAEPGLIFAGNQGACTITVENSGCWTAQAVGTVRNFTPGALSFVDIPGFANNVDVSGNYAFVAAGAAGLQLVDVADRAAPRIVASFDTPGSANDVRIVGDHAFVADGAGGLRVVNVADPLNPSGSGAAGTAGNALDVVVRGNLAFVAAGAAGLEIYDVTNRSAPLRLGSLTMPGLARGVEADLDRAIAVVASSEGMHVVDVANASSPALLANLAGGDVRDVVLQGNVAFLADLSRSFTTVDLTDPSAPVVGGSLNRDVAGLLVDVATAGTRATGADIFFVNGVPLIDVSNPAAPVARQIIRFDLMLGGRDDDGTGVALDRSYVYLTAAKNSSTRLYIGQYSPIDDPFGIAPQVTITAPPDGETVIEGTIVGVRASATDDVGVAAVSFFANGQPIGTDPSSPYATSFRPTSPGTVTLNALAVDFGGNAGTDQVTVEVTPDPLTTVIGRVVDKAGAGVDSATVGVFDAPGSTSGPDGSFVISNVPTILGSILVSAIKGTLSGRSVPRDPVPGGVTDVGDVMISETPSRLYPVEVTHIPGGRRAFEVETADLNSDGNVDAVVALVTSPASVAVLLGKGDGSFEAPSIVRFGGNGAYNHQIELADVNADGMLDILSANSEVVGLSVALGNGDGTFAAGADFDLLGRGPVSIQVGDLDGDNHLDVVTSNSTSNDLSIVFGNGDGTFRAGHRIPVGRVPYNVRLADLNGDGSLDVVASNSQSNNISVLLGNGDGTLQTAQTFATGNLPWSIAIADMDSDGTSDVLVSNGAADSFSVLLGNGDGTFQAQFEVAVGERPAEIIATDVNADGLLDVLTANVNSNNASVVLGNGDGTFQPSSEASAANSPQYVATADLDNDGRQELLLGGVVPSLTLAFIRDDGTFPTARKFSSLTTGEVTSEAVGDLNNDGFPDVVATSGRGGSGQLSVLLSDGSGSFAGAQVYVAGRDAQDVAITDLNRDGRSDVVIGSEFTHSLDVMLGVGDGTLLAPTSYPTSGSVNAFALADFDRDGSLDAVVGVRNSTTPLSLLPGRGDGGFEAAQKLAVSRQCNEVTAVDLDDDRDLEIVCVDADGRFSVFLGNGDGTFLPAVTYGAGMRPSNAVAGDVNGDGDVDIVLGGFQSSLAAIHLGNGDGTFQPPSVVPGGSGTSRVTLSDLDGDGLLDIAATGLNSNDVTVLLGTGDGTFEESGRFFAGREPISVSVADIDVDGNPDLVMANRPREVTVLLNQK